ncbi:MAG: hypothetical protein IME99_09265 [Proteobacteria bacterium]|nr:hypothetical protein [Pseudomonadota bacterium]
MLITFSQLSYFAGTEALHLLILAISPLIILVTHSVFSRINSLSRTPKSNQSICLLAIFVTALPEAILLALFGLFCSVGTALLPTILYSVIVYLALGYTYFHLFNMSETARRIRLLYEIKSGLYDPHGATGVGSAEQVPLMSVTTRLERLVALGQIEERRGRYFLKGRTMLYGARVVRVWGMILGIDILSR